MSADLIGVGIVGASLTGGWALESHVPAVLAVPGVSLSAVATSRARTAAETSAAFGAGAGYAGADELARDPAVDIVTVAVKVIDHRNAVESAIAAGKAVYCEWPLGVTTQEAEALRDLASASGVPHFVGLQGRLQPAVVELRRSVESSAIGDIVAVTACSSGMGHGAASLPASKQWVLDEANGLSALTVRAAHTLDALQHAVGPLTEIAASVETHRTRVRVGAGGPLVPKSSPDRVLVRARLANGAPVNATFLLGVHGTGAPLLTVYGTEGTLEIVPDRPDGQIQMCRPRLVHTRDGRRTVVVAHDPLADGKALTAGPARSVARMYASLEGHGIMSARGLPTFDDAVGLHRLLDEVRSASFAG